MQRPPAVSFLLPLAGLVALIVYLMAFANVPIFFDEAAFRRVNGRAFMEGFVRYSVFPDCRTPTEVGWLFVPAHSVISALDGWIGWERVRFLPILSVSMLAISTALLARSISPNRWMTSVMVLAGGFVGVAGAGMVLARAEFVAALHASMVVITFLVARKSVRWGAMATVVAAHVIVLNLSLFVHQQGFLLAPFSILSCAILLRRHRIAIAATSSVMIVMTVGAIMMPGFECPEDPELERLVAQTHGVVLSNQLAEYALPVRVVRRLALFVQQFPFQSLEAFSVPVPTVPQALAIGAGAPVAVVVALNFLILLASALIATGIVARLYFPMLWAGQWRNLTEIFFDGRAIWTAAAIGVLAYSASDLGGMFYRAHFRNLLTAVVLAIGVASLAQSCPRWVNGWAFLICATSIGSAVIAWTFLAPKLKDGFESHYVSLLRDWPAYDQRIRALAKRCGIGDGDERVAVDVATYQAMSRNPKPIDFNYVWYRETLEGKAPTRTPDEWKEFYRRYSTSGYVVMCRTLSFAPMTVDARDDELCCARF